MCCYLTTAFIVTAIFGFGWVSVLVLAALLAGIALTSSER